MSTEYRFSLTPRLIALAAFGGVALCVLLFALGFQVGQTLLPEGSSVRADKVTDRMANKLGDKALAATGAATDPLRARAGKAQKTLIRKGLE